MDNKNISRNNFSKEMSNILEKIKFSIEKKTQSNTFLTWQNINRQEIKLGYKWVTTIVRTSWQSRNWEREKKIEIFSGTTEIYVVNVFITWTQEKSNCIYFKNYSTRSWKTNSNIYQNYSLLYSEHNKLYNTWQQINYLRNK